MTIIIDTREAPHLKKIMEKLAKLDDVQILPLPVGDIFFSGNRNILVERKTVFDFIHSLGSGRLWDQVRRLASSEGVEPIFIIQGYPTLIPKMTSWTESSFYAAVISIILKWRIPLVLVLNNMELLAVLRKLHKLSQEERTEKIYPVRLVSKKLSPDEQARAVLESFPGIGARAADRILRFFGSLEEVFRNADRIDRVEGIGRKTKEKVLEILRYKYRRSVDQKDTSDIRR